MRNYLKNSRGAVTLFILVCVIFFFIALVNVQIYLNNKENSVEEEYRKIKQSYDNQNIDEVYSNKIANPIKIPKGFKKALDSGDTIEEGIVIEDKDGNQYVWIPVPKKTEKYNWGVEYPKGTTEKDYTKIEEALINTTNGYTRNYKNGNDSDVYFDGCGLTQEEYTNFKNAMLTSIFKNEGFFIGRYEAGIDTFRTTHTAINKETTIIPSSKEGQYPFTSVYWSEAQILANKVSVEGYTSSMMFGVQWNCVMVYLENCGWPNEQTDVVKGYLKTDSKEWGNYKDSPYTMDRGKYSTDSGTTWIDKSTSQKGTNTEWLYTTGACDQNSKCNIYDLPGNVWELTLEKSGPKNASVYRGGCSGNAGTTYKAANHRYDGLDSTSSNNRIGFRVAFY
ncbi:MAG: hypothetical protein HFJ17_02615 [Clostridia bacterium]|nr:hypothetical protein [Clostridia bacterium]